MAGVIPIVDLPYQIYIESTFILYRQKGVGRLEILSFDFWDTLQNLYSFGKD